MSFEIIVLLLIIIPTFLFLILRLLFKNGKSKFADFINRIWDEWFEEQYNAIYFTIIFFIIIFLILFILLN